ncbi:hypothetical protein FI667_g15571, partial [Globisporangium splendens]
MEHMTPQKGITILRKPCSSSTGGGLLAALRRIVRRKKPKHNQGNALPAAPASGNPSGSPSSNRGGITTSHGNSTADAAQTHRLSQMIARLSMPVCHTNTEQELDENNSEDHSDAEDDEEGGSENEEEKQKQDTTTKFKLQGKQRRKWVKKLLNQSATPHIHKDRVYRTTRKPHHVRHCRHRGPLQPPKMLTVANALHTHCVARILGFLGVSEPARTCAYVNKALAASVRVFYETYCLHPRPQRYLANMLLQNGSDIMKEILGWFSPVERACVSSAAQFAHYMTRERVETRFEATKESHLEDMHADEAVAMVRFLDTNDENECFQALTTLSLQRIRGFWDDQQSFEQFIQVSFTARVSRRLQTLELSDVGLEDPHYKYLATLSYDAQFPSLRCLNLSRNQFSSRFMRDWHRSFINERFGNLQTLDITVSSHLQQLFSYEALTLLSEQIASGKLRELRELTCSGAPTPEFSQLQPEQHKLHTIRLQICAFVCVFSAISGDANAMGNSLEAFHGTNGANAACPKLEQLNISGNSIANAKARFKLAQVVAKQRWATLTYLDISSAYFVT